MSAASDLFPITFAYPGWNHRQSGANRGYYHHYSSLKHAGNVRSGLPEWPEFRNVTVSTGLEADAYPGTGPSSCGC